MLIRKVKQGDPSAMETLIKANLRFVVSVAKAYQNRGLPLTDLISEGNIGLIKAAKKFDETRGFKLISYAVWWIRQSIIMALQDKSRVVRMPSNHFGMVGKVRRTTVRMEQELEREPSSEEVGEEMSLSTQFIGEVMYNTVREVSLDASIGWNDEQTIGDMLEDPDSEEAVQQYNNIKMLKDALEKAISTLSVREANILRLYYGLGNSEPLTYKAIGDQLGCSMVRVRQIKEKALLTLKNDSKFSYLKEYMR